MRPLAVIGVILILIGIVALAFQTISFTTKEQVAKVGPIEATTENQHNVALPPILGVVAIVIGGGLVFAGRRRA
ncbi:MAG: hypothetical protein U1E53_16350 [Dongiaceae bacterium]